jgi:cyclophilin family peptidyl-prolyl cis-trans isomerase
MKVFPLVILIVILCIIDLSVGFLKKLPIAGFVKCNFLDKSIRLENTPNKYNSVADFQKEKLKGYVKLISSASLLLFNRGSAMAIEENSNSISAEQQPEITHKVYLDIKIANYTEESTGTNRAASGSGRLIIGLYGKEAPQTVRRFLEIVQSDGENFPTFVGTQFTKLLEENRLLTIEKLPFISEVTIAGKNEFEYRGNLLNFSTNSMIETNQLKHNQKGLLTRKLLSPGAEFSITMSPDYSRQLDGFNLVFGRVLSGFEASRSDLM